MEGISLREFGLSGNEEKIYLALLGLGSVSAGVLIKKTGMHRAAIYDNIDILSEKGLVSYVIKANRKYFFANEPQRLRDLIDRKKDEIKSAESRFAQLLPILTDKKNQHKSDHEAYIYEGKKGLRSLCDDILKYGNDMLVFGAQAQFSTLMGNFFEIFQTRRANAKIKLKIIYNEKVRKEKKSSGLRVAEMRFISQKFDTPSSTWIYADKVALIIWAENPVIFLMKSKQASDSYRQLFSYMWGEAKK